MYPLPAPSFFSSGLGQSLRTARPILEGSIFQQDMVVEDIVELLIREFLVDPLRADWDAVLNANRRARGRDRNRLESV